MSDLTQMTNGQIKLLATQRLRRMCQLIEQNAPVAIMEREFSTLTEPAVDEHIRREKRRSITRDSSS